MCRRVLTLPLSLPCPLSLSLSAFLYRAANAYFIGGFYSALSKLPATGGINELIVLACVFMALNS